jgi:hypothetical protein
MVFDDLSISFIINAIMLSFIFAGLSFMNGVLLKSSFNTVR